MAITSNSELANPLDKFQSFSTHHILMVSDTSESLRAIQNLESSNSFDTSIFQNASLTRPINGTTVNGSSGVYVVIDSRKNSNFHIIDIKYQSSFTGGDAEATQVITEAIEINIHDPFGINFVNYIQYLQDEALFSDFGGMSWLLKTIFIGHTDTGSTEMIQTSLIPMMLFSIDVDFDVNGGTYNLKFGALSGGAPVSMQQTAYIGQSCTCLQSNDARTLWSVIQDFQNKLNTESKDWYNKKTILTLPSEGSKQIQQGGQKGRYVQFMITIPETWAEWTVDGNAQNHEETKHKKDTKLQKPDEQKKNIAIGKINISLDPGFTVTTALNEILKHCDSFMKLCSIDKRKENDIRTFKILSSYTSDSQSVCIHYDIIEYLTPNISIDKKQGTVISGDKYFDKVINPNNTVEYRPKNSLEFDYFYSGKNKDILNFEMKLRNLTVLIMDKMNSDVNVKVLQNQKNDKKAEDTKQKTITSHIRKNSPIFLPIKTKDQLTAYSYISPGSSQDPAVRQQYMKTLSDFAANNSYDTKIVIRGNPNLLVRTLRPIPPHVAGLITNSSNKYTAAQKQYIDQYLSKVTNNANTVNSAAGYQAVFPYDPATYPVFIKVNVYRPNVDFDGKPLNDNFAEKFWYDKYHIIFKITHIFDSEGNFTQEIEMGAYTGIYEAPVQTEPVKVKVQTQAQAGTAEGYHARREKIRASHSTLTK